MTKIRVTLLFIFYAFVVKSQRQFPSNSQFFPQQQQQRPNLQLIQLHAAQQQQRPSPSIGFPPSPLNNQRRLFRTRQQQQSFVTRQPVPRISLRRRNLTSTSAERNLRAGISRNKPARIILDPNLSNEKITSDNRFPPQLRTQGNADFSRVATTPVLPVQRSPGQSQRRPPPIEVTPSRVPLIRPPVLRRPPQSPPPSQTLPQRPQQLPPQQQQQRQFPPQRPPQQQQPQQRPPPPRPPPLQQQQNPSRIPMQQQQQQLPQRAPVLQQRPFIRPPPASPAAMTPRMPQNFQNRPPSVPPTMQRQQMPRPQTRPQSPPPPPQQQPFTQPRPPMQQQIQQQQQLRPPPTMPSPPPPPPPPQPQPQQQMRPRITPEQRFTRPEQARILPPSSPIGPPRPQSSPITTNNIDDPILSPSPPSPIMMQSRVRPSPSTHMPGFLPPSNSVVDELNNSNNFLEVARRLHLRRVIRGSAH